MLFIAKIKRIKAPAVVYLFALTAFVLVLQSVGFERSLLVDLTAVDKITTRDDRLYTGASVATFKATEKGINFECQVLKAEYQWPFCELKFDLSSNENNGKGIDLSNYNRIGLWIEHDHKSQPGTRVELHNFNNEYSDLNEVNSLKYNTVEFSDNNTSAPTWINFQKFSVPTWWNASHNTIDNGTEFNDIRSMSLTTGAHALGGLYKLTVKRIEFRGKYIENDTLFLLLIMAWSSVAGFFFRQLSISNNKVISVNQQKIKWQEKAFKDSLTGVNNRESARDIFNDLLKTNQTFSLLFLDIDFFKKINDNFGHNIGDEIIIQFANTISEAVDDSKVLIRWGGEEFLLLCPRYDVIQAKEAAEKLRKVVEDKVWVKGIKLTVSVGVAEKENYSISELIGAADKALYQAKENGRNQVVVAATE